MGITSHVLEQPNFWTSFTEEVLMKKSWKCGFSQNVLTENIYGDAALYGDDATFLQRRKGIDSLSRRETDWAATILQACKELVEGKEGNCALQLKRLHVLDALKDYVDHLDYFYKVASIMDAKCGDSVLTDLKVTPIHDIDKLDPAMLTSYSERFEDNKNTSLWFTCVNRHTRMNPHHQAHRLWTDCCQCGTTPSPDKCDACDELRTLGLKEMVCDKVSRKLQKELGGKISDAMWDVDIGFYKGLPTSWLNKATELAELMKRQKYT